MPGPIGTLASLEDRLNELSQQLETESQLAEIGLLAAAVAHEINNALTPVIAYSQLAAQQPNNIKTLQNALQRTLEGAIRAVTVSQTILDLAKAPPSPPPPPTPPSHQTPSPQTPTSITPSPHSPSSQTNSQTTPFLTATSPHTPTSHTSSPSHHACDVHAAAQHVRTALLPIGGHAIHIQTPTPNLPNANINTHWLEHALQNLLLNALRATKNATAIHTVHIDFFTPPTPPFPPSPSSSLHPLSPSTTSTFISNASTTATTASPKSQHFTSSPSPSPASAPTTTTHPSTRNQTSLFVWHAHAGGACMNSTQQSTTTHHTNKPSQQTPKAQGTCSLELSTYQSSNPHTPNHPENTGDLNTKAPNHNSRTHGTNTQPTTSTSTPTHVGIRIRDIGPGFPQNHFKPISNTTLDQNTPRQRSKSQGLGLQIAATLIHKAGGQLQITSPPNKPTCIEILIPTHPANSHKNIA